jgi:RNA ligase (TIGR02306 family)
MTTKLATIQMIKDVTKVPDSDNLDVVSILGWKVVTRKGEFKPGDFCVYISLDSILPEKPEFEFLRKLNFRVRTAKLRGQISQGLVFPLSILPPESKNLPVESDVTEILEIKKYEKEIPAQLRGMMAGSFPTFIPKTDEERLQNIVRVLEELKGIECYSSVKIDGTSATFAEYNGKTYICSRRNEMQDDGNNVYSVIYRKYDFAKIFEKHKSLAIQGEIAGPKIQKNPLKLSSPQFFAFNIYDIKMGHYYGLYDLFSVRDNTGIPLVPIESIFTMNHSLEQMLEMAKGKYESGETREGIVVRPTFERISAVMKGSRLSFKVVNNDYKE